MFERIRFHIQTGTSRKQREAAKFGIPIVLTMLICGGGVTYLLLSLLPFHTAIEAVIGIVSFATIAHTTGVWMAKLLDRLAGGDDGAE